MANFYNKAGSYTEVTASELREGDRVLTHYYDTNNEFCERDDVVESVKARRYGKATRYIVQWAGYANTITYKPEHIFGRGNN